MHHDKDMHIEALCQQNMHLKHHHNIGLAGVSESLMFNANVETADGKYDVKNWCLRQFRL